jgi:hypothetical protein
MFEALTERCSGLATWQEPLGGFFAWLKLDERIDSMKLLAAAKEEGVDIVGGSASIRPGMTQKVCPAGVKRAWCVSWCTPVGKKTSMHSRILGNGRSELYPDRYN